MSQSSLLLDGYEVSQVLGAGATGTVYQATQLSTGRDVAVKMLNPQLTSNPEWRERFRVEARLMTRFDDENLVNVYDFVEADDHCALVMQYVPGTTLRRLIDKGERLNAEQALGVMAGALSGLAAAHRLGVVHGDLKPENVIVTAEGVSRLVDFGQASPMGSLPSGGSPSYASPEALQGTVIDQRSDIYSAGVILFELLAGRPPFDGSLAEITAGHLRAEVPRLKDVPQPVADLVAASLSVDPARRPATAEDFLETLETAATTAYGSRWRERAGVAALAGALIGGSAGVIGSGPGASASPASAARRLRQARRTIMRTRHVASSHPVTSAALAVVVVGGAVSFLLLGSPKAAAVAGRFGVVSLGASTGQLTCTSPDHCLSVLGSSLLAVGPGAKRSISRAPGFTGTIDAVSCPSAQWCLATGATAAGVGAAMSSSNAGRNWSLLKLATGTSALTSVSCAPSTRACWAGSASGFLHTVGGSSWTLQPLPSQFGTPGGITCLTARACVSYSGSSPAWTTDGGQSWHAVAGLALLLTITSLSCSGTSCWVVGAYQNSLQSQIGAVWRSTDGGQTWVRVALPAAPVTYGLDSISCWTASSCLADGTIEAGGLESSSGAPVFFATTNAGQSWKVHAAPPTLPFAPAITCPGAQGCWLSGPSGLGFTDDGGSSWQPMTYAPRLTFSAISCTSASACYAAGSFPYLTLSHLGAFIATGSNPMAVVARVGGGAAAWSLDQSDRSATGFNLLSCTPVLVAGRCIAVGTAATGGTPAAVAWPTGGTGHPSSLSLPKQLSSVAVLSCPAQLVCWVGGQSSSGPALFRSAGKLGWASVPLPLGVDTLSTADCSTATSCLVGATGATGPLLLAVTITAAGPVWRSLQLPAALSSITALSCPDSAACWLAGVQLLPGQHTGGTTGAVVYRNLAMSKLVGQPAPVTSSATTTSSTVPVTTGASGSAVRSLAGLWTQQPLPAGMATIASLSCPTPSACFGVGTLASGTEVLLGAGLVGPEISGSPPTTAK